MTMITRRRFGLGVGLGALAMPAFARMARAEVTSIRLGKQYGLPFLPQMVMEAERLIEKHAAASGVPGLQVRLALLFSEGVGKGRISLNQFVALTATRPPEYSRIHAPPARRLAGSSGDPIGLVSSG